MRAASWLFLVPLLLPATARALSYEEFRATVYQEPGEDGVFIVNGDEAIGTEPLEIDENRLREFYDGMVQHWLDGQASGARVESMLGADDGSCAMVSFDQWRRHFDVTLCFDDALALTELSVMHYPQCNGTTAGDL